jgi:hypothetical protein
VISPYDVKLNGKKYLVVPSTYHEGAAPGTIRPYSTPGGSPGARNNEEPGWAFLEQSVWRGDTVDDWREGTGGYYRGHGVDITFDGQIGAAKTFTQSLAEAGSGSGYLLIPFSDTRVISINKATGFARTSPDMLAWTDRVFVAGVSRFVNSYCFYKGTLIVSDVSGDLWTTNDQGVTWVAYPGVVKPAATSAVLLGSYRSKLYIAWGNDIRTWDGTTLTALVKVDGTPICGAVGAGAMFILAQGIPAHLYLATGDQLVELLQWPGDFQPQDAIYTDTLYTVGGAIDASGGYSGEFWRYSQNGIEQVYEYPQLHGAGVDYRIFSVAADGMTLLFSANRLAGIGQYDSSYDQFMDPILGFSIGSKTAAVQAVGSNVSGILAWRGVVCIGITGLGLYTTGATFCDFQVTSSLFGADSKRVTKMWGFAELTHTPLLVGQSFTVSYSTDGGTTWVVLGTKSYAASYTSPNTAQKTILAFPAQLLSPTIQYRIDATCNGVDLSFLDISLSFMEATQNPKRRWSFVLGIGGSTTEPMNFRDGSEFDRSGPAMKTELDALWNKRFAFEDVFGTTYQVTMPSPAVSINDVVKELNPGNQTTVESVLADYRVTLVEV